MMLAVQPRRLFSRPKNLLIIGFIVATLYWMLHQDAETQYHDIGWHNGAGRPSSQLHADAPVQGPNTEQVPLAGGSTQDSTTQDFNTGSSSSGKDDVENSGGKSSQDAGSNGGTESSPTRESDAYVIEYDDNGKMSKRPITAEELQAKKDQEEHDRQEGKLRKQFEKEDALAGMKPGAGAIYGNTLATLVNKTSRVPSHELPLKATDESVGYTDQTPFIYDPFPRYNGREWQEKGRPEFVPCDGPNGRPLDDVRVFKGAPRDFPDPSFGSWDVLDMDKNLCFERETRLGPYGFTEAKKNGMVSRDWDLVNWGYLQEQCWKKNSARYKSKVPTNPYLNVYASGSDHGDKGQLKKTYAQHTANEDLKRSRSSDDKLVLRRGPVGAQPDRSETTLTGGLSEKGEKELRTAILLRVYTGHQYSENDKQIIRSLVSELSLRTGGQYQIFLFVHVKDPWWTIWEDPEVYDYVLNESVPSEFHDMAILWNDQVTQTMYPKLDPEKVATVHVAQWLSVQKFSQDFPEFDFVWNWELDARVTGHHYDFLEKMVAFARKQPRRGLWERSERYYIPEIHGDYDTEFREEVERRSTNGTVWGPPELPFIKPQGPKPPVKNPEDDDYQWGVGEEADLITVAPIFNPVNSSWIGWFDVWGYNDSTHDSLSLPRRATIVTQSRVSKRLLDLMHVENKRGNHISSEMTTQTVALLHGLKAVYAPMPVFFDRPWSGKSLEKWFNAGPFGDAGGNTSAYGWGREGRFLGSTWYYRATPPQRLYLNWMGWEDTNIGGPDWEPTYGRPCLPPMMLHPIKDVEQTWPGYFTTSELPYS